MFHDATLERRLLSSLFRSENPAAVHVGRTYVIINRTTRVSPLFLRRYYYEPIVIGTPPVMFNIFFIHGIEKRMRLEVLRIFDRQYVTDIATRRTNSRRR